MTFHSNYLAVMYGNSFRQKWNLVGLEGVTSITDTVIDPWAREGPSPLGKSWEMLVARQQISIPVVMCDCC